MAKLSKDLGAGTLHPRELIYTTGNIAALNSEVIIPADSAGHVTLDLRGTYNLTIEVSGSVDGVNWVIIPVRPIGLTAIGYVASVSTGFNGVYAGSCVGFRQVRARCIAFTSGLAVTTLSVSNAPLDQSLSGTVTPLTVTNTAAVSTAVTATLPAPGAGLRHYITYLSIARINGSAAALTAAAGPVNITTTNIPGSMVIAMSNDALATGAIERWREDFAYPIATSVLNTATTFVAPAQTGVIWRITVGYYVAP
jgi:hypothetical protein